MHEHTEKDTTAKSPFGFWTGFLLGMGSIALLSNGQSRPQAPRYPGRGGLAGDWQAVARDAEKAAGQIQHSMK